MKNLLSCNCNKPKIVIKDNEEKVIEASKLEPKSIKSTDKN